MIDDSIILDFEIQRKDAKIYLVGDGHIGAREHQAKKWGNFLKFIEETPEAYVIIVGDMLNNTTRSSVGDIYDDLMNPSEQKRVLFNQLLPIKDKIVCGVPGNHESRSRKDTDMDPLYDVFVMLGIQDRYRRNACYARIKLCNDDICTASYKFVCMHGKSVTKEEWFSLCLEDIDAFITGHTHRPRITRPAKIVFPTRGKSVYSKSFVDVVVPAWLDVGGYALRDMYRPQQNSLPPYIGLRHTSHNSPKKIWITWGDEDYDEQ